MVFFCSLSWNMSSEEEKKRCAKDNELHRKIYSLSLGTINPISENGLMLKSVFPPEKLELYVSGPAICYLVFNRQIENNKATKGKHRKKNNKPTTKINFRLLFGIRNTWSMCTINKLPTKMEKESEKKTARNSCHLIEWSLKQRRSLKFNWL